MGAAASGGFLGQHVRVAGVTGDARESSQARALTLAIARAIDLKVDTPK